MAQVLSYNDAQGYLSNPSAFSEAYMRGANIWKDAAHTQPRDCQRFFLSAGMADGWATLAANVAQVKALDKRVGFRLIEALHGVPSGWPTLTVANKKYVDFRDIDARYKLLNVLTDIRSLGIDWHDIIYPFAPSNEPSINDEVCRALGNGDLAQGRNAYIECAKLIISIYVNVFDRAVVGNLGGPSWAAEVLLPYQKLKGVRAFRQDSFGYFDYGNGKEGENRARLYDDRIAMFGGRGEFDRLIFEVTGNGLVKDGIRIVDQGQKGEAFPWENMLGVNGEFQSLEATDFGNMGLKAPYLILESDNAAQHLADWYAYVDATEPGPVEPPGDGGTVPPVDEWPQYVDHGGPVFAHAIVDRPSPSMATDICLYDAYGGTVRYPNRWDTAAFLRAIADKMEGKV
jgi:hypothetical protein